MMPGGRCWTRWREAAISSSSSATTCLIRQALEADLVDELTIIVSPVILGGGKRLFEGFTRSIELEQKGVRQSAWATFIEYTVKRSGR
jgi:dihydrofolate reductase